MSSAEIKQVGSPRRWSWRRSTLLSIAAVCLVGLVYYLFQPSPQRWRKEASQSPVEPGQLYVSVLTDLPKGSGRVLGAVYAVDVERLIWRKVLDHSASALRVAPNAKKLAYLYEKAVWVQDLDGEPVKVADLDGSPIWSPDSARIFVSVGSITQDSWKFETWKMRADGAEKVKLPIPDTECVRDLSPDGKWFLTFSVGSDGGAILSVMHVDGSQRKKIAKGDMGRFAANSKDIAYIENLGGKSSICIVECDNSNFRKIMDLDANVIGHVAWIGDGGELAVCLLNHHTFQGAKARLEIVDRNGNNRRVLKVPPAYVIGCPDWR